ncbi:hypothetical protein NKH18_01920 [Streptomyces sp. M10(2022)]
MVKLSAAAVEDPLADDSITRWQRGNEDLLRAAGMEWTLLRPRSFMSNALAWAGSVRTEHVVRALYGSSVNAWSTPRHRGCGGTGAHRARPRRPCVHADRPQAVSAREQTAQLAELLGRPLRFEELEPGHACALWSERHPASVVEALLDHARRQRDGAKTRVENTVAELVGRPARSFQEWAGTHLSSFMPL